MNQSEGTPKETGWRRWFDFVTSLTMLVAAAIVVALYGPRLWQTSARPGIRLPTEPVALAGLATKGTLSAPLALIVYSDFDCPYCLRFARDVLPVLDRGVLNDGQVILAFKHLPLDRIHPLARRAAALSECARRQSRFWPVHDSLFALPKPTTQETLAQVARQASVEEPCMAGPGAEAVERHINEAKQMNIQSTPTFLWGRNDGGRVWLEGSAAGFRSAEKLVGMLKASTGRASK